MRSFFKFLQEIISGAFPLALLIICGVYLTLKCRFLQFRKLPCAVKSILIAVKSRKIKSEGISSLQAACTCLSATVGTGNIAGVAGAISIGGAGAVFWMWISALLGMIIKYAEITLGIKYRRKANGKYIGGPMLYIKSLPVNSSGFLSTLFAAACIPAVICTGNITQSNVAALSFGGSINARIATGIIFTLLTFAVIAGGVSRIGAVTEKITPIMSAAYLLLSAGVIALNTEALPSSFKMILTGAFDPKAVTGGSIGSVMSCIITGASRGVFSNEAGLGTSAMAHSAAFDADVKTQGLFGIFEVFFDTVIICTVTGLTILCSGVNIEYGSTASADLVGRALYTSYGALSGIILPLMMCVFAFSSVIGWALYGNICSEHLAGETGKRIFTVIYPLGCAVGAAANADFAWSISGFFNGIMLCINLPAILMLSNKLTENQNEQYSKQPHKRHKSHARLQRSGDYYKL